jgi:ATP-dependent helicase STH1/SNF2
MTEQLEHKQCTECECRAKQEHLKQLNLICVHGKEMVTANCAH